MEVVEQGKKAGRERGRGGSLEIATIASLSSSMEVTERGREKGREYEQTR